FRAYRRDLLGLDGAFMKGPFPGQVLATVGLDSNNGIYLLAYALVEAQSRAKSDLLLNNICEVFNGKIVEGRDKPVITVLEYIREYCMKRIVNVQSVIDKFTGPLTPTATRIMKSIKKEAHFMKVQWNGANKYKVLGIPCKHVVAACWNMALNDRAAPPPEKCGGVGIFGIILVPHKIRCPREATKLYDLIWRINMRCNRLCKMMFRSRMGGKEDHAWVVVAAGQGKMGKSVTIERYVDGKSDEKLVMVYQHSQVQQEVVQVNGLICGSSAGVVIGLSAAAGQGGAGGPGDVGVGSQEPVVGQDGLGGSSAGVVIGLFVAAGQGGAGGPGDVGVGSQGVSVAAGQGGAGGPGDVGVGSQEPVVGQDGSGGSGAGVVIGLSVAAGQGGAGGPGDVGVGSQGYSLLVDKRRGLFDAAGQEPVVGQDGSGGSSAGVVIGLSVAAGQGGAGGPGDVGVGSQEPVVGQDGSGGSSAGVVIGLSIAAGQGGAGGPGDVGVGSQGDNNAEASGSASRQAQQTEPAVGQDGLGGSSDGAVIGQPFTSSQVLVSETRNADGREMGDGVPTHSSAAGGATEWSFL
ncbi:hypothetical protein Tco_0744365, partial [Tanacetum coccineum]